MSRNPEAGAPRVTAAVAAAITSRRSLRRFLDKPVPRSTVEQILEIASRAPSGTNMQPWKVHVVAGATKAAVGRDIVAAYLGEPQAHEQEYRYYPPHFPEPYLARRRKVGWDLYGLLGIVKGDKAGMQKQHARNFVFFDAPVGLIFTIDRVLEKGSWLDYGMFLQNIMVAARGAGLHSCPQAAFAKYHRVLRRHLDIPDDEVVVCGMSLGHADLEAPENSLVTEREPLANYTVFHDF